MPANQDSIIVERGEPCALTPKTIHYGLTGIKGHSTGHVRSTWLQVQNTTNTSNKNQQNTHKLNRKRRRHPYTSQKWQRQRPTKSHKDNLITIKSSSTKIDTNLIVSTCNIQSIRNKELQVSDLLKDYSIDILALTEMWLTDNQRDEQWLQTTPNRDQYRIHVHNRKDRRGGGVALIVKNNFITKLIRSGTYDSFCLTYT